MDTLSLLFDRSTVASNGLVARRHAGPIAHRVPAVRDDVAEVARRSWEDRARQEYVGVMLTRHLHGLLVEVNAPMDVQEAAISMMLDEQRHTALAIDAARALGSIGELSFDAEELRIARRPGESHDDELLRLLVGMLVVSEVVALDLLVFSTRALPPSSFRDVLRSIAKDEVFHARFGGLLIASLRDAAADGGPSWLPYPGDGRVRAIARAEVAAMRARDVVHASERELFDDPDARAQLEALGVPPPDAFRAVYAASLDTSVPAALAVAVGGAEEVAA